MKKESLTSARDSLKERAMSLWTRLSCPEPEAEMFKKPSMSTLSDDIRQVRAFPLTHRMSYQAIESSRRS